MTSSEARTDYLDAGVAAATLPKCPRCRWWPSSGARQARQPIVDRASATLMYAGRNRSLSIRRKLPQTWNATWIVR